MTISAQPRPPGPSDPVDGDEFDALVEALIKEARRRARRRRLAFASVAGVVALADVSVFALLDRTARSPGSSPGPFAKAGALGGATRSRIAFVSFPGRRPAGAAAHAFEITVINADGSGKHTVVHWRGK